LNTNPALFLAPNVGSKFKKERIMNRVLILLVIGFIIISCKKNDNSLETNTIDIGLLNKEWKVVEQSINNSQIDPFVTTSEYVNIDTQEVTTYLINLGESIMVFDNSVINFSLHTDNEGSFSGKWSYDNSNNELIINSYNNNDTTWNQSVAVDGLYLPPNLFLNKTYKIQSLSSTELELTYNNVYLKLEAE
jgi:hypothetical protein